MSNQSQELTSVTETYFCNECEHSGRDFGAVLGASSFQVEDVVCPRCRSRDTMQIEAGSPVQQHSMLDQLAALASECDSPEGLGSAVIASRIRAIIGNGESSQDSQPGRELYMIDPSQWEPCSPESLKAGTDCAHAPRVWSSAIGNHLHPKSARGKLPVRREPEAFPLWIGGQQDNLLRDAAGGHNEPALPMMIAPRDSQLVQLLVRFTENPLEDTTDVTWTIGHNEYDANGEDSWSFAGWCWNHDHYTQGQGTPIGWRPLPGNTVEPRITEAMIDRAAQGLFLVDDCTSPDPSNVWTAMPDYGRDRYRDKAGHVLLSALDIEAGPAVPDTTAALFTRKFVNGLYARIADLQADRDSWSEQASERVKDWDEMRQRAEKAEAQLQESNGNTP